MKKNIFYSIACVMVLMALVSCKKDFLDRYPQTSIPPDLFFKSEQDLSLYINGMLTLPSRDDAYLGDQNTDDKATTGFQEINSMMTTTPSSQTIINGWSYSDWQRLRDINYFLENYDQAAEQQAVKDHYAGLARFYRAMFYMNKVKRYSDVPWYSKTLNPTDPELNKGRDSRAVVVDSIMADLEFAATHVRSKGDVPAGTPYDMVVKLVQARIALYEGTFRRYHPELNLQATAAAFLTKAAAAANDIITSNQFSLAGDYASLFNSANLTGNPEVLLARIYDHALGLGASQYPFFDYEMSPSKDLVQTYLMKDGSRYTDQAGYQTFQFVKEFQNRDPRLSKTVVPPGAVLVEFGATRPYVQLLAPKFTGYHQMKGYINSTDAKTINDVDLPAYRYAEALLIYAEAKAELGELTQSDLDNTINLLRARAGITTPLDLATANSNPDPVLAAKYPDVTGANKGVILEIRREKRVEFAAEGYRFDDLMRWHAGKELEKIQEGLYFPGLGSYDLTGDGVIDITLIDKSTPIPDTPPNNSLGVPIKYYQVGTINDGVTVALKNGTAGGPIVTDGEIRNFAEPKFYYRPVPNAQVTLNPNLGPQLFGWN
ncbi:MAG: RagB/SusD family nutrient uptake outer membrane protein [Chitinophagaceae bacterium]